MRIPPVERKRQIMAAAIPKARMNADSKNSMPTFQSAKGNWANTSAGLTG
jgi:hypothetical protein